LVLVHHEQIVSSFIALEFCLEVLVLICRKNFRLTTLSKALFIFGYLASKNLETGVLDSDLKMAGFG
jgi:hypothetical protein